MTRRSATASRPSASCSIQAKLEIAKLLDELGIDRIEAGFLASPRTTGTR
jgi:isopropylmalate/homocitrate/citramalate synthase